MIIKIKYMLLIALAALVSCSSDEFVGDSGSADGVNVNGGENAISFNLNIPNVTRAEVGGGTAAAALNNQFIIWGEKNESDGTAATTGNLVFKNYIVRWTDNSAYTTTSNTKNWEYVGYKYDDNTVSPRTTGYSTYIKPNTKGESEAVAQTIKYWDFGASSYTFTAVSALPSDITAGNVVITKNVSGTTVYDKGYEIAVKSGASVDDIFIADRNQPATGAGTDRNAINTYGGNVTMKFRNFMSKIRFGIYEDIPGYKVKITKVYYNSSNSTINFGVDGKFIIPGDKTKFQVTYESANNKAIAAVVGWNDGNDSNDPSTVNYFETAKADASFPKTTVPFLSATEIGTTAPTATFNKSVQETDGGAINSGLYTTILPFTSNNNNLKLKIDYQLISGDTGETIDITGKEVEVPAQYCQWKSNYAYSYLFKITDSDLYPITFDAVEVTDENGLAEYITTVSQPSITTFGVKDSKYTAEKNEYENGTDIYATFVKGGAVQTPSLAVADEHKANYVQIYQVTTTNATTYPITELSVAERLAETPSESAEITCTNVTTSSDGTYFTGTESPSVVSTVPAEDGTTKTIKAVKLPGAKTNTYAIEYITYEAVSLSVDDSLVGYYSESEGTYTKQVTGTYESGTYYKQVKTYKVIKVEAAP